jgi:hypothetical protein
VTTIPPRRRQQSLRLDGVWLLTQTSEGTHEIPGMSVVADSKGFTIAGPESGNERTVAWELTTGFTCQRPARLPDGSPATVLEVGLANGRVLELLLPVTRVPPSETVVVETELVVMSEMYGGGKPRPAAQAQGTPEQVAEPALQSSPVAPSRPSLSSQSPRPSRAPDSNGSNGSNGSDGAQGSKASQGRKSRATQREGDTDDALSEVLVSETREQVGVLAHNGSHSNGNRVGGSSKLATGKSIAPGTVMPASPISDPDLDSDLSGLAPESAAGSATVVADPASDAGAVDDSTDADVAPEPVAELSSEGDPELAEESDPDSATTSGEVELSEPEDTAPEDTELEGPELENPELEDTELEDTELEDTDLEETDSADGAEVEPKDRRENRMFHLLMALIGVVVVVLIAELMLILFVLNHNSSSRQTLPGHGQTTLIIQGAPRYSPTAAL